MAFRQAVVKIAAGLKIKKARITLNGTPMTELREVTCHTGY